MTSSFSEELNKINPELKKLFVQNGRDYLQELNLEDQAYLGKYLEKPADLPELQLLETHIYSLLSKLVPGYPYANQALKLLPVLHHKRLLK